jgi:hypothetical protein
MKKQNIHHEHWHTLIVLDACRYDCFKEIIQPAFCGEGRLYKRWSTGANTGEWIKTQLNKDFSDVYYVSANPWVTRIAFERYLGGIIWGFKGMRRVWFEAWDDNYGTVHPWAVCTAAKERPQEERLIIHFMQPHVPFINEAGKIFPDINKTGWKDAIEKITRGKQETRPYSEWGAVREGRLSLADAIQGYRETLAMVIPYLLDIVAHRPGRTVITADHGEEFGEEEGFYGHPGGYREAEALRTVPWMILDKRIDNEIE